MMPLFYINSPHFMSRNICLKIVFCLFSLNLFYNYSYASDTLYYAGNIKISKSVSYKYYLRFTISAENTINGYSLSDPGGPNETKTKIIGTYDSLNKIINFEEKTVLRSKVDLQKNDLCFVKASLKLKKNKLIETLSGEFIGTEPSKNTTCATGEIRLINTDKAKSILNRANEVEPTQTAINKPDPNASDKTVKISDARPTELLISGSIVKFTVWDNGIVDDDEISIMFNNKYILENYILTASSKTIEVPLSDRAVDTVKIIAMNEGKIPPNTAMVKIESKTEEYPIQIQAKLHEVRTIYLRKKTSK